MSSILDKLKNYIRMIDFKDLKVKAIREEGVVGEYEITPLPRGYGHTLANSLRRILLSSLSGAAITAVKVHGVDHEYTTIEGMKEDVVEVLLNLKGLRFRLESDDPQVCMIDVTGQREVTGADVQISGPVEVTNPDMHIATLTSKTSALKLELTIEKGIGYRPADEDHRTEMGMIPVDADFSPVKKVSFEVINARKGQATDLDAVHITVTTDGSVTPQDALLSSAKILQDFAGKVMAALGVPVREVEELAEQAREVQEVVAEGSGDSVNEEVLSWRVEDLPISKRSKSGLLAGGFETIADVSNATTTDLLNLPGFGNKSLSEVLDLLGQYNIEIKSE